MPEAGEGKDADYCSVDREFQLCKTTLNSCVSKKKLHNLDEMDTQKLPKLTLEETENLNRPITSKQTESVIKNLPTIKAENDFTGEFYQTL